MNDPRVKAVDLDLVFHQDSVPESPGKSITMAIGNTPIPPFMEDVDGGCQDPGIVKVAIIDGGIDASHPDFSFCGKGFCEGRRFMNPTNQDWGTSTNAHGSHVVGVSFLLPESKHKCNTYIISHNSFNADHRGFCSRRWVRQRNGFG